MFKVENQEFEVQIERKRIRNIYLRVEGNVLKVTCPYYVANYEVYNFLESRKSWIMKVQNKKQILSKTVIDDCIFYLGKKYNFVVLNGYKNMIIDADTITIYYKDADREKAISYFYEQGKKVLLNNVFAMEDKYLSILRDYGYHLEPIYSVKYLKSMWGVCYAKKNNIHFSARLIHFSEECLEAILWHELLHFVIPNHSKRYHELIQLHMPRYKEILKELR